MKFYKRIISSILGISSVIAMMPVNTMAVENIETNVYMGDLADTLSFQLDLYYDNDTMETLKADGLFLGSAIPAYYEDENGNTEIYTQAVYYPVYSNGDVIGIFNVFHGDENDTYSYSEYLSDELNEYKFSNPIVYINDEDEKIIPGEAENDISCYSDIAGDLVEVYVENTSANSARATSNSKTLYIESWNQKENGYTALCWAGSIWSIGEYVSGSTFDSPYDIADEVGVDYYGNTAVYISNVKGYLSDLYGITTTRKGVVSQSAIKTSLTNDKPIYMEWDYSTKGHATALCGYKETDTKFGIRIMDPYGGIFRVVSVTSSSDPFTITLNGHTYTWARSLVIQ